MRGEDEEKATIQERYKTRNSKQDINKDTVSTDMKELETVIEERKKDLLACKKQ